MILTLHDQQKDEARISGELDGEFDGIDMSGELGCGCSECQVEYYKGTQTGIGRALGLLPPGPPEIYARGEGEISNGTK